MSAHHFKILNIVLSGVHSLDSYYYYYYYYFFIFCYYYYFVN